MLSTFFNKKKGLEATLVSLVIQPDSVTVALLNQNEPAVRQIASPDKNYAKTILESLQEQSIVGAYAYLVLSHGMYQITQVDKPSVPEAEYDKALRFSAKDYFTIAPENQLLEYYQNISNIPHNNKLNVVACDRQVIRPILEVLQKLELNLIGISIADIVLTNFIKDERLNLIIFHNPGSPVLIAMIKDGELCFSRHIHGYDNLHQLSEVDFEDGALSNLEKEIQRSIDYAAGQLKIEGVSNIYVCVQNIDSQYIVRNLQEFFDIEVSILKPFDMGKFERFPLNYAAFEELLMETT